MPALPITLDPVALFVAGLLLKGTALLAAAYLVTTLLRRASAGTRHLVWAGGVTMLLVLPVLTGAMPWQLPVVVLDGAADAVETVQSGPGGESRLPSAEGRAPSTPLAESTPLAPSAGRRGPSRQVSAEGQAPGTPSGPLNAATALFVLWVGGALVVLGRLALGVLAVRRITRARADAHGAEWTHPLYEAADRLGLDQAPQLVLSTKARMPFAAGVVRPVIVLPAEAAAWTDRRRRAVLSHELAHIRRRDLLVNIVAQLACAAWWFHPLAWVAAHRLRVESERACDDLVLGIGTRASEYADHLLQIVCRTADARTPAVALPMARRREFEGRMLAILEPVARRGQPNRRHATIAAAAALAFIVPLSALGTRSGRPVNGDDVRLPTIAAALPDGDSALGARRAPRDSALGTRRAADAPSAEHPVPRAPDGPSAAAQDTTPRVVLALMRALSDSVESVRKDAAYALGRREARAAVAPLADRMLRDPSADVREMAVWSLAQIGDPGAVTPIAAALVEDASAEVRAIAAWALGQFEDASSVMPLAAALLRDSSAEVRGRAAWALGQIEPKPAPPALVHALRDSAATVRYRTAWALGQIEDPATIPALVMALRTDTDREARKAAIWAIGRMDAATAQDGLLAALEDGDAEVRAAAIRALAGHGSSPWPWPWPMPRVR